MILPCIALAISIATLAYVLWNGWKLRQLRQQQADFQARIRRR
jgi:hypothetical protein